MGHRIGAYLILGTTASVVIFCLFYAFNPDIKLKMQDRSVPASAIGFYPNEVDFQWTKPEAEISLPGLDRSIEWKWTVVFQCVRPAPVSFPDVTFLIDGRPAMVHRATGESQRLDLSVPRSEAGRGLKIGIHCSNSFVPGRDDPRELGIVIRKLEFHPCGIAIAPPSAILTVAIIGLFFSGFLAFLGLRPRLTILLILGTAILQAYPLSQGWGPFDPFYFKYIRIILISVLLLTSVYITVFHYCRRSRISELARLTVALSLIAFQLQILILLHPEKTNEDVIYHAHRLGWVLTGRFFFTSIAARGEPFPYPVGFYMFAAPFTLLIHDHVTLLRTLLAAANTGAAMCLYSLMLKSNRSPATGMTTVILYLLIPYVFEVQALANMANAFAQAIALTALLPLLTWKPLGLQRGRMAAATGLLTAAFLTHTSIFCILSLTVFFIVIFYYLCSRRGLRRPAIQIAFTLVVAFVLSVLLYYAHFPDVYRSMISRLSIDLGLSKPTQPSAQYDSTTRVLPHMTPYVPGGESIPSRILAVPHYLREFYGWPILTLVCIGTVSIWRRRARDGLVLGMAALALACFIFLLVGTFTPVDMRYYLSACPFIAFCAAEGSTELWSRGNWLKVIAIGLLAWAACAGIRYWLSWLPS